MIKIITNYEGAGRILRGSYKFETTSKGFSNHKASAIISAANSFGIMDGGSDVEIAQIIGLHEVNRLKHMVEGRYYGEIPVGGAAVLKINNPQYDYLIAAPTMRAPKDISGTDNVYQATRAILIAMSERGITSAVMPLLGTGYGKMDKRKALEHIVMAERSVDRGERLSFDEIRYTEDILYGRLD